LGLWTLLKRSSFDATLEEPPDIVVTFGEAKIGIAKSFTLTDTFRTFFQRQ
jgi:hypothetical protein